MESPIELLNARVKAALRLSKLRGKLIELDMERDRLVREINSLERQLGLDKRLNRTIDPDDRTGDNMC